MPERIAKTDPFTQITEYIGSGPMKFMRSDWVPGAKAVFEKFADYKPRSEKADWLAGGKKILVDRIEWVIMPDPATAAAALQNGEVDWWETPLADLVPVLKGHKDINVDIGDPLGNVGAFRMNHLFPPFNNVKVRQAVLTALNQEDYMRAVVGDDDKLWKPLPGFFTPGTPLYTEEGGDILKKRNVADAKKLLAEAGYPNGFTLNMPTTPAFQQTFDLVAQQLSDIGITVNYTDPGSANFIADMLAPKYPATWMALEQNPDWQLINFMIAPNATFNPFKSEDPKVDALISTIQTGSQAESDSALKELNKYIVDQAWFAPFFRVQGTFATDPNTNLEFWPTNAYPSIFDFSPKN